MTEHSTFTAPESGRYHAVSGQEPHLIADCGDECQIGSLFSRTAGSTSTFSDRGMTAELNIPMDRLRDAQ